MKKKFVSVTLAAALLFTSVLSPCQSENVSAAASIRVSKTRVTVEEGEQVTVRARNTGNRRIKAKVSNKKIVSVKVIKKKIRITGKKMGNTKVTLTAPRMKKCVIRVVVRTDDGEDESEVSKVTPVRKPTTSPYVRRTARPSIKPSAGAAQSPTRQPGNRASARPSVKPGLESTKEPVSDIKPGETTDPDKIQKTQEPETPFVSFGPDESKPSATPKVTNGPADRPSVTPKVTNDPAAKSSAAPGQTETSEPAGEPSATPEATQAAGPNVNNPSVTPEVEPTVGPTDSPAAMLDTTRLYVADKSLYIGESVENLKADWGEPERIDPLPQKNITGYIYNSNSTTKAYLLVGIKNQKVTSYFTIGKDFTAYDATVNTTDNTVSQQTVLVQEGASAASMVSAGWDEPDSYEFRALDSSQSEAKVGTEAYYQLTDNAHMYAFTDYFDGGDKAVYGFYAFSSKDNTKYDIMYRSRMTYDDEILQAAEKQVWEMTNAYRNYMGMSLLQWEDNAAAAAKKHSQDMAENNYFSHYSQDKTAPGKRLQNQGISWNGYAENICAGSQDAISMVIGWIGSSGHRKNILSNMKYIGVGAAYSTSSDYGTYATQDFWN